jgi:hypothetical protein
MDLHSRPRRSTGFHLEQVDDEVLLYHPGGNKIIQLNQPALIIWQLCDGQSSMEALIALLQEAYPESAVEISADVQEILQQFIDHGCVELG